MLNEESSLQSHYNIHTRTVQAGPDVCLVVVINCVFLNTSSSLMVSLPLVAIAALEAKISAPWQDNASVLSVWRIRTTRVIFIPPLGPLNNRVIGCIGSH